MVYCCYHSALHFLAVVSVAVILLLYVALDSMSFGGVIGPLLTIGETVCTAWL